MNQIFRSGWKPARLILGLMAALVVFVDFLFVHAEGDEEDPKLIAQTYLRYSRLERKSGKSPTCVWLGSMPSADSAVDSVLTLYVYESSLSPCPLPPRDVRGFQPPKPKRKDSFRVQLSKQASAKRVTDSCEVRVAALHRGLTSKEISTLCAERREAEFDWGMRRCLLLLDDNFARIFDIAGKLPKARLIQRESSSPSVAYCSSLLLMTGEAFGNELRKVYTCDNPFQSILFHDFTGEGESRWNLLMDEVFGAGGKRIAKTLRTWNQRCDAGQVE